MNLREYYDDMHSAMADLGQKHRDGVVYVTSVFNRDRNSIAGNTMSASVRNAARAITDGTHRVASEEEVRQFLQRQQDELRRNTISEQKNKRQYMVVLDQKEVETMLPPPGQAKRGGDKPAVVVA